MKIDSNFFLNFFAIIITTRGQLTNDLCVQFECCGHHRAPEHICYLLYFHINTSQSHTVSCSVVSLFLVTRSVSGSAPTLPEWQIDVKIFATNVKIFGACSVEQ